MPAAPSPWLLRWQHLLKAGGSALDLACGSGRHTRHLAALGMRLTAVDRNAEALAGLADVAQTLQADLEGAPWPLGAAQFDLVLVSNYLWRPLLPRIVAAVAPDGWLIYETFADGQQTIGRPSNPDFLLRPGELLQACTGLRVIGYEDGFEGSGVNGRFVQRVAAVRASAAAPAGYPLHAE